MRKTLRILLRLTLFLAIFLVMAGAGTVSYFHFAPPEKTCISCHEMLGSYDRWTTSAHREVDCRSCHGGSLTLDFHAIQKHANRLVGHFSDTPKDIRLAHDDVLAIAQRCRSCHQHEYADWSSGGHSATYQSIFLNDKQNKSEAPNADCLRCHGMFFEGTIEDLVTPIDNQGPWQLKRPDLAAQPIITCLSCHHIHIKGHPADKPNPSQRTALAFYSRHEKTSFPLDHLPAPALHTAAQPVRTSTDPRQRLCVQCHAPNSFHQAGSADDHTPRGVHEGLSCAACHKPHSNSTQGACVTCHPKMSHCGLDVQKMDTSYLSPTSKHDIHSMSCGDCHNGRRP